MKTIKLFPVTGSFAENKDIARNIRVKEIIPKLDKNENVTLDFKDVFTGRGVSISYNLPSGKTEYLDVRIPPGVKHGDVVNFGGCGVCAWLRQA